MTVKVGSFWHFSDLHLDPRNVPGAPWTVARIDNFEADTQNWGGFPQLWAFLDEQRLANRPKPVTDALVISGDLVDKGGWSNPQLVRDFIERLRGKLGVPAKRVLVVPGNHDVNTATALKDPSKSRAEFDAATKGYATPATTSSLSTFADLGLAFILADTVSLVGVPVGTKGVVDAIVKCAPGIDVGELTNAVRGALAAEIPSISAKEVHGALADLGKLANSKPAKHHERGSGGGPQLPTTLLGFLVSHYPLLPQPYGSSDVKQFLLPIGTGPAKKTLAQAGFHVCLHGHQHLPLIHAEITSAGGEGFPFRSIGAGSLSQKETGFNIVEYALSESTGEARLLVRQCVLSEGGVRVLPPERVHVPPRGARPATAYRMVERISQTGDVRSDVWWTGMSTEHWRHRPGGRCTLKLPVLIESDRSTLKLPVVHSLTDGLTAEFRATRPRAKGDLVEGRIELRAPRSLVRGSMAYRLHGSHVYAISVADRRRSYGQPLEIPNLEPNEEGVVTMIKESSDRFELYLRTPFDAPQSSDVEVRTYVEDKNKKLVERPELAEFSKWTVDCWPKAKRVRFTVQHPLRDVGYGIIWRLPEDQPEVVQKFDSTAIERAIEDAEKLRKKLRKRRKRTKRWRDLAREHVEPFFRQIVKLAKEVAPDSVKQIEIAILLPDREILTYAQFAKLFERRKLKHPHLEILAANFPENDRRCRARIPAGHGLAGRAYSANQILEWDDATSERYVNKPSDRAFLPVDPYVAVRVGKRPLRRHRKLYAIPIRHWDMPCVVVGCLAIGSYRPRGDLNLSALARDGGDITIKERIQRMATQLFKELGEEVVRG